jgi:flavodoxin
MVPIFVMIGYPTWLSGAIKASDWLKFILIFFSDTTWRMELKIVMKVGGSLGYSRLPPQLKLVAMI